MSQYARKAKKERRLHRGFARSFYSPWRDKPEVVRLHELSERAAAQVAIPDGYEQIAFRLPKFGEKFVNSDGHIDYAAYPWEEHAFGHGPRKIVRKKRCTK